MKKYQTLLLQKYLNDDISTSELETFFKHLEELDPIEAEEICRERWIREENDLGANSKIAIREGVLSRLVPAKHSMSTRFSRNTWFSPALKIAASVAIVLSLMVWLFRNDIGSTNSIAITTDAGQQIEWMLPDQTMVTLNENSTLSYSPDFNSDDVREVYLDGEAYFEVKKEEDRKRHFKVIATGLAVDVLGTVFNVNTTSDVTEVYLEEGSVRLTFAEKEEEAQILMHPGDLVKYSSVEQRVIEHVSDRKEPLGMWKDNIMFFNKVSMKDVFEALATQYSLQLNIEDKSVLDRTIIAGVPRNNLEQAIETIEKILGVDLVLQGGTLRIN